MDQEHQATGILLNSLLDEMRSQRVTSSTLSEALGRNALELERLSMRVHQLHGDLNLVVSVADRVSKIEAERADERTRGKVYASMGAAIAAAIGAITAIAAPWLLGKI